MVFKPSLTVYLSGGSCVHHFHDPDPGASRRSSGSLSAEDLSGKSTADLYRGKHYPDSVYPAFYPADL